jgi:hypothetical protein
MHAEMPPQFRQRIALAALGGDGDRVDHGFSRQRLSQQPDDAEIEGAADVLRVGKAGNQDDLGRERIAECGANCEPIRRRHDEVEQNNIRVVDRSRVKCLTASRGSYNRVALLL